MGLRLQLNICMNRTSWQIVITNNFPKQKKVQASLRSPWMMGESSREQQLHGVIESGT